jgi:hypothetical protein
MQHELEDVEAGYIQIDMPVNGCRHVLCGSCKQALMRMSGKKIRCHSGVGWEKERLSVWHLACQNPFALQLDSAGSPNSVLSGAAFRVFITDIVALQCDLKNFHRKILSSWH